MAKVLHITAHPHDHQTSYSMAVGKAFIDAYREANPSDEVTLVDLYRVQVPHIDADVFSGWGKLRSGQDFSTLTGDESAKVSKINEFTEQFIAADKYVFVTPMWNFSFPPVMKAYLDALCVAGKTFKYTEAGPVGLLNGKKALHIQARGGVYSEGPAAAMESGHRYISIIMGFFGIPETQGLFVEGHNQFADKAEQIKAEAISKAQDLAKSF
ncbi:FMN-dependent NADH-azoreductase [Paenibacillus pectinilyticus]|uniref:FMN dependent NADH:quinone oxidoreductase n=1 Tax=Paenibacillus pectinilyticus TaxID=512399 RepID=A0A1C1A5Q6_9BACL|nr:FMN-dependent NADH-azoreductase [Paenibacillus pectinilyticus]OCT15885.1 FMN-dependent NADH-azoreductase [Paenibacillus pectinilyticus]